MVNFSTTNVIEVSALNQKKEINFRVAIIAAPYKKLSSALLWIILVILIIALGAGGFFGYKYRTILLNFLRKGNKIDKIKVKIKKLEEKEKQTAIMNMINILRILKNDDVQIRSRLKQEDFSDEEIDQALASEATEDEEGTGDDDLFSEDK